MAYYVVAGKWSVCVRLCWRFRASSVPENTISFRPMPYILVEILLRPNRCCYCFSARIFFLFSLACLRARLPSVHVLDKLMALFLASFLFNSFVSARLKSMIAPMCSTKCLPLHVNVICVEQGLLINFFSLSLPLSHSFFLLKKTVILDKSYIFLSRCVYVWCMCFVAIKTLKLTAIMSLHVIQTIAFNEM